MPSLRSLEFDVAAFEDLAWWVEQDRTQRDLKGCWSRRVDREHRLVYQVHDDKIRILACRYHYRSDTFRFSGAMVLRTADGAGVRRVTGQFRLAVNANRRQFAVGFST